MPIKCDTCGYMGLAVCKVCYKSEQSCNCGQWKASCPKCGWIKPEAPDE